MKPIRVNDQVRLRPVRCMVMTLRGITYRLFRSMVTVSILMLAVAFLVHIVSFGLIERSTTRFAWQGLLEGRVLGEWVTRLSRPDPPAAILPYFADPEKSGVPRMGEYRRWGALNEAESMRVSEVAGRLLQAWQEFQVFPVASRVVLLGGEYPEDPWSFGQLLADPEVFAFFSQRLRELGLPSPLKDVEKLKEFFTQDFSALATTLERVKEGHRLAVESLKEEMPAGGPAVWLASDPGILKSPLQGRGFAVDDAVLQQVSQLATAGLEFEKLRELTQEPLVIAALAREMKRRPVDVDLPTTLVWLHEKPDRPGWLADLSVREVSAKAMTAEVISGLVISSARDERYQRATGGEAPLAGRGLLAFAPDMKWLIVVSFLVCVVGVSNAMLMSVTERVSEIATMKCLGALNGFVMQIFFFEALMQGVLGGLLGIVLGVLLALLRGWSEFGNLIFESMPFTQIMMGSLLAWATGLLLAAGAAIGPVWVAARLAPMEAMRVE